MDQLILKRKMMQTLGEIIKTHRTAKQKTMYAISAESSMSKSTWREAELGEKDDINLTTLWKISEGLDIPINILLSELQQKLGDDFSLTDLS